MAGKKERGMGFIPGIIAALCWSVHFPLISLQSGATPPLVFYAHCIFWAAISSMTMLTLVGRIEDLSLINRKSGTIIVLALTGGIGLWLMLASAFHLNERHGHGIEMFFYTGPIFLAFLSLFTRSGTHRGRLGAAIVGFGGVTLVLYNMMGDMRIPVFSALALTLAASAFWAFFSIAAYSLLRKTKALPVLALTFCTSAVCLFLVFLPMQQDVLSIDRGDIWISIVLGGISIAGGYGFWMKCMSVQDVPANAATWWYAAPLLGAVWYHFLTELTLGWPSLAGIVLILLSFKTKGRSRERVKTAFGDMLS